MAAATQLPPISQALIARESPNSKVWEHRKELSHWASNEVPLLKLAVYLDTDHWAKLKGKHIHFVNRISHGFPPNGRTTRLYSRQKAPEQVNAFQRYYYDQSKHREELLKNSYAMYYQGKPMRKDTEGKGNKVKQRPSALRHPSIFNQRAKEGFKYWLERDPMINRITLCSKYTFGSKNTFHGLGNAPRN